MGGQQLGFRHLNVFERLTLYGICGFAAEVSFTAIWEAIEHGNRKLLGVSSVYVFFVYSCSILLIENLYLHIRNSVNPLVRGICYMLVCYSIEFMFGSFLKIWNACPWDYASYFQYHYLGLITFEYIPVWFVASLICERYLIHFALNVGWIHNIKRNY